MCKSVVSVSRPAKVALHSCTMNKHETGRSCCTHKHMNSFPPSGWRRQCSPEPESMFSAFPAFACGLNVTACAQLSVWDFCSGGLKDTVSGEFSSESWVTTFFFFFFVLKKLYNTIFIRLYCWVMIYVHEIIIIYLFWIEFLPKRSLFLSVLLQFLFTIFPTIIVVSLFTTGHFMCFYWFDS